MVIQASTQFCERCQAVKFDEVKYGAMPILTPQGFRLGVPCETNNKYVQEGFNTGIKEHLSLFVFSLTDSYPQLPQLSVAALSCNFCSFLKQCLLSREVTLAVADHGVNLDEETFQIGLHLSYSWQPRQTGIEAEVGLDALYIYILNIDQNFSKSAVWGPGLGSDVFCVVRCAVFGSSASSALGPGDVCTQWLRLRQPYASDKFNQQTVPWMHRTLQQCETGHNGHEDCVKLQAQSIAAKPIRAGKPWMPTRLIDVSGNAIKLITMTYLSFDDAKGPPKYTALSYCWGLGPDAKLQLTTTASTKSERKKGIAFSELSPVQQDAVTITRNMDIQYVWIDSICIIQQDKEDWLKESSRMGSIYSYAFFTIVSLMSTNQSSFLSPSVPDISIPFQSSFPAQSGIAIPSRYTIRFSCAETHASSTQRLTKLSPHLAPNRWVTRGWTLQEQALSRRLLLFGPAGVRFICQSSSTTPTIVEGPPRSILRAIQELQMGIATRQEGYEKWRDFARDFSGRLCTKRNDRLPALWGLAILLGKSMGIQDEYAAGLWRGDLVKELLWRHMSPQPRHDSLEALLGHLRDPRTCIAPSWSWIDRFGITFFCYDDAVDDRGKWEEEYQLVNGGKGTFGRYYGPLKDSGRLALEMSIRILGLSELWGSAKISPRGKQEERPFNDLTIDIQGARFHCMLDWCTATEDGLQDNIQHSLEHIQFVLLASARLNEGPSSRKAAIGLILYPEDSLGKSGERVFVRIGAFYSVPDGLGGVALFTKSDAVQERISIV